MNLRYYKREEEQKKGMSTGLLIFIILLILFFIVAGVSTSNPVSGFIWIGYGFEGLFNIIGSLFSQKIRY